MKSTRKHFSYDSAIEAPFLSNQRFSFFMISIPPLWLFPLMRERASLRDSLRALIILRKCRNDLMKRKSQSISLGILVLPNEDFLSPDESENFSLVCEWLFQIASPEQPKILSGIHLSEGGKIKAEQPWEFQALHREYRRSLCRKKWWKINIELYFVGCCLMWSWCHGTIA